MLLCLYVFQVLGKPFVVNHIENPSSFPTHSSHAEALASHFVTCTSHDEVHSSSSSENRIIEQAEGEEDEDNILHVNTHHISIQFNQ